MAAQSSFEFTSVFREEAVVVFWYLIFDGLKLKLDFVCLIFTSTDITVIMWVWLAIITEKSNTSENNSDLDSDDSETDGFVEHSYEVLFVPDDDIQQVSARLQ